MKHTKKSKDILRKADFLLYYIILICYPHKASKFSFYRGTKSGTNIDPASQIRAIALFILLIRNTERKGFD